MRVAPRLGMDETTRRAAILSADFLATSDDELTEISETAHYGAAGLDPASLDREAARKSRGVPVPLEAVALRVLQELSRYYVPYAPPLGSPEAIAAFADRLDRALAALIEGTASMQYAFLAETRSEPLAPPRREDLAAQLLDWTSDGAAIDDLASRFRAMLGHHRRLVSAALTTWQRALDLFHPLAIEAQGRPFWGLLRHRKLWAELRRRHGLATGGWREIVGHPTASVVEALGLGPRSAAPEERHISPRS
jgi:hypothetical protein